jgi:hypothetical protein
MDMDKLAAEQLHADLEYLYALSQLSVAFLGFSAVVITVREISGGHGLGKHRVLAFKFMAEASLITVLFCLLPYLLNKLFGTLRWDLLSISLALLLTVWYISYFYRDWIIAKIPFTLWVKKIPFILWMNIIVGAGVILVLVFNWLILTETAQASIYIATLTFRFCWSGVLFAEVLAIFHRVQIDTRTPE